MSKDKLIPELRFPEFEGDGEWIYKRLGETGKVITGKTPSTKDASLWNGEILFITPTDIDENQKYQLVTNRTIVRNRKLNIDRKSTRLNSSHVAISYAVFCLKKK